MTFFLFKTTFIFLSLLSFFGWGALLKRGFRLDYMEKPFYTMACGFSLLIFIGGTLNVFELARPKFLSIIFITGIFLGIVFTFFGSETIRNSNLLRFLKICFKQFRFKQLVQRIHFVVLITIICVLSTNLIPTTAYNAGDDLRKYIPRTERMLQTGTLGGDPFNGLGLDSLGAQNFFQGFILSWFGIEYLDSFDSVFCFVLTALVMFDCCVILRIRGAWALVPLLFYVLIHPQKVNISSLYSGALIIVSIIMTMIQLSRDLKNKNDRECGSQVALLSLFSMSLLCLKLTFWPYLFFQLVVYFALTALVIRDVRKMSILCSIFLLYSFIVILPWILIYRENYFSILSQLDAAGSDSSWLHGLLFGGSFSNGFQNALHLFDRSDLFWGGNSSNYTLCVLVCASTILLFIGHGRKWRFNCLFPAFTSGASALAILYFLYPFVFASLTVIRYMMPILCALLPLSVAVCMREFWYLQQNDTKPPRIIFPIKWPAILCFTGFFLWIAVSFTPTLLTRHDHITDLNASLSFPRPAIEYQKRQFELLVNDNNKKALRRIQHMTEKGTGILTWTAIPFFLDYTRNRVFSMDDIVGLTAPWIELPIRSDSENFRVHLKSYGIDYVLWDYNSDIMHLTQIEYRKYLSSQEAGLRATGILGTSMYDQLKRLFKTSDVVFNNGYVVLFKL